MLLHLQIWSDFHFLCSWELKPETQQHKKYPRMMSEEKWPQSEYSLRGRAVHDCVTEERLWREAWREEEEGFWFFFSWILSKSSLLLLANPSFCSVPFVKRNLSGIISKWYYFSKGRMTRKWHTTQNAPALCKWWINRSTTWCACFSSSGSGCLV